MEDFISIFKLSRLFNIFKNHLTVGIKVHFLIDSLFMRAIANNQTLKSI